MELTLAVNTIDCVGCYACEIACKQEHNLPVGPRLIRVYADGPRDIDGRPQMRYKVAFCLHCKQPACRDACPNNAISINDDGIVVVATELCTGCQTCVAACPHGVMQFDEVRQLAVKCDMCLERLIQGEKPACVNVCPSRCIICGEKKEVARAMTKARGKATAAKAEK